MTEQPNDGGTPPKSEGFPGFVAIGRLATAVTRFLDGLRSFVRDFALLARAEIIVSAKALGTGVVLALLVVGLTLLAAIFLMIALAYGLVFLGLPAWLAFLIVAVMVLIVIVVLAMIARKQFKTVTLPTRTLAMLDEIGKPGSESTDPKS
ncbi:MAG: hypothetical protein EBU85_03670 [Actinobacteria bacterium]|nr:hypothetical protein [Actinomycetota bacterium]